MQIRKHLQSILGKAALATAALGGIFMFAGAPGAQAQPVRYYNRPVFHREVIVRGGFYGPRFEYRRFPHREYFAHGWRDRYGYWHRY